MSHSVGASWLYASPRATLRRNARWLTRRRALVDGGVAERPVDRQPEAHHELRSKTSSSMATSSSHSSRKFGRDDRHGVVVLRRVAAERRLEPLDVGLRRVAPHAVVVLHAALGRQAVVVPPHRVEDGLAAHALVAGDGVGVGVAEHVAHVQRSADGGRRRVDGEHAVAGRRRVEAVRAIGVPLGGPAFLDAVERRLVGDVRHRRPRLPFCSVGPHGDSLVGNCRSARRGSSLAPVAAGHCHAFVSEFC